MASPGGCQAIVLKATQINQGWEEEVSKQVNNHPNYSVNAVRDRRAKYYGAESKTLWCDMVESFQRKWHCQTWKGDCELWWGSNVDLLSKQRRHCQRRQQSHRIREMQGLAQGVDNNPHRNSLRNMEDEARLRFPSNKIVMIPVLAAYPLRCYIVYFAWIPLLINSHRQEAIKDHLIWSQQCWTANQMLWLLIQGETQAHHSPSLGLSYVTGRTSGIA